MSVKFNDQHIPDSPFKVYVAPSTGDSKKLTMQQQDLNLQVSFRGTGGTIHKL